VAAHLTDVPTG